MHLNRETTFFCIFQKFEQQTETRELRLGSKGMNDPLLELVNPSVLQG